MAEPDLAQAQTLDSTHSREHKLSAELYASEQEHICGREG
jgi:hypothetical protein